MWKYYKVKIHNLSEKQLKFIYELSDIYRFCYNWGLNYHTGCYKKDKSTPSFIEMCTEFTHFRNQPGHEWLLESDVNTCRYAFRDLKNAFDNFWAFFCRYPKYKSRKFARVCFKVRSDRLNFLGTNNRYVTIPGFTKIAGRSSTERYVDLKRHNIPVGPNIKYDNVHITHDGVDFWLSLSIRVPDPVYTEEYYEDCSEPIGIDVGLRKAATLSNGQYFEGPDKRRIDLLEHRKNVIRSAIGRDITRRRMEAARTKAKYEEIPRSKNELKREKRFRKTISPSRNIYKDRYHKIANEIVNMKPRFVAMETIIPKELIRENKYLAPYLVPARLGLLIHDITYKCINAGIPVYKAPKDFPSTQLCSSCGSRYKVGRAKRYKCPICGMSMDRDLNAAINLLHYGEEQFTAS